MTRPLLCRISLALASLSWACAAQAGPVLGAPVELTLTGWHFGDGAIVQASGYTGPAGAFEGRLGGTGLFDTDSFLTYCIELEEGFRFGTQPMQGYVLLEGASYFEGRQQIQSTRPDGQQVAQRLGQLRTWMDDNSWQAQNAAQSAGLQLAIWNIVYDNDFSVKATTGASFSDGSVYASQANLLLAGAASVVTSRYDVFALQRSGTQDFVLWSPITTEREKTRQGVPEPAGLALVATGLLGLAWTRRRKAIAAPEA